MMSSPVWDRFVLPVKENIRYVCSPLNQAKDKDANFASVSGSKTHGSTPEDSDTEVSLKPDATAIKPSVNKGAELETELETELGELGYSDLDDAIPPARPKTSKVKVAEEVSDLFC
jgi:hypothetical protein